MQPDQTLPMSLEALAQFCQHPHHLVQAAASLKFTPSMSPSETESDDDPPDWKRRDERWTIDGLLGSYEPSTKQITIFRKGIAHIAQRFGVHQEIIERSIRIHEWGHAIFHLGVDQEMSTALGSVLLNSDNELLRMNERILTERFEAVEPYVHEQIAQAITLISLQGLASRASFPEAKTACELLLDTFRTMSARQPNDYSLDNFKQLNSEQLRRRLRDMIGFIRQKKLQGERTAWDTLLRW